MKKILKIAPAYLVLAVSSLFANAQEIQDSNAQEVQDLEITQPIKNSFGYINVGSESLFSAPFVGCGFRAQKGHHGLDLSASIVWRAIDYSSCFIDKKANFTRKKANLLYNFFFFPNLESQFYVGFGAGVNYIDTKKLGSIVGFSPEIALGKQYKTRMGYQRFIQLQISLPGFYARSEKVKSCHDYVTKMKADLECSPLFTFTYGIGF